MYKIVGKFCLISLLFLSLQYWGHRPPPPIFTLYCKDRRFPPNFDGFKCRIWPQGGSIDTSGEPYLTFKASKKSVYFCGPRPRLTSWLSDSPINVICMVKYEVWWPNSKSWQVWGNANVTVTKYSCSGVRALITVRKRNYLTKMLRTWWYFYDLNFTNISIQNIAKLFCSLNMRDEYKFKVIQGYKCCLFSLMQLISFSCVKYVTVIKYVTFIK